LLGPAAQLSISLLSFPRIASISLAVPRGFTRSPRYAELGIAHYWIVDPDRRRLECFRLSDSAYHRLAAAEGDAPLAHPVWSGLTVDLAALWR
jgi:hypothetical protein